MNNCLYCNTNLEKAVTKEEGDTISGFSVYFCNECHSIYSYDYDKLTLHIIYGSYNNDNYKIDFHIQDNYSLTIITLIMERPHTDIIVAEFDSIIPNITPQNISDKLPTLINFQ